MSRHCPACGAYQGHKPDHPCAAYRTEPVLPDKPVVPVIVDDISDRLARYRKDVNR